ncbi:MAG: hypothetical protein CM15mP120_11490 [Pseudomonadota bacterium]|nr:MAG: hypothetical protein CM15mP120_11490 [Pseudomonadota bacterium]
MSEASLNERQFFGHPIGLRTLFLTEMWERMSYYGMRALLVLYMTGAITGFNPGLGWSQIDAQAIYGVYVGLVYFMVVPGGWVADNILGHQRAVLYGAIIIALGHLTLAVPLSQTFFLGLTLVVLGTGLLKGNISTIVGKLYADDDPRRDSGFTIFYMSINIGSTIGLWHMRLPRGKSRLALGVWCGGYWDVIRRVSVHSLPGFAWRCGCAAESNVRRGPGSVGAVYANRPGADDCRHWFKPCGLYSSKPAHLC